MGLLRVSVAQCWFHVGRQQSLSLEGRRLPAVMIGDSTAQKASRYWSKVTQKVVVLGDGNFDKSFVCFKLCKEHTSTADFKEHRENDHISYPSNDGEEGSKSNNEQNISESLPFLPYIK